MNITKFQSFTDNNLSTTIKEFVLFESGKNALIHEKNGHILIFDSIFAEQLKKNSIPIQLKKYLGSRGFLNNYTVEGNMITHYGEARCIEVRPEFFMIDLTNKCNMRCSYCLRDIDNNGETITNSVLKDICNYIENYCLQENLSDVSIQPWGGEPLLMLSSILYIREHIHPQKTKVHISIETNGTLLTKSVTDLLFEKRIGIGISIDGNEKYHDSQRVFANGNSSFQIVENNLRYALSVFGKRLGIITTVTRNNYKGIEDIFEYYAVSLKVRNVKMNFVHKSQFVQNDDMCLTSEEIAETELSVLKKIVELRRRGYDIIENNIAIKLKNILFNSYTDICLSKGCCGGRKMVVFDMDGNFYPCELTDYPDKKMGSIYEQEEGLAHTIQKAIDRQDFFREKTEDICDECPWKCYCMGGCTTRLLNDTTDGKKIDKIECSINRVLYPALIELILDHPDIVNQIVGYEALKFGNV